MQIAEQTPFPPEVTDDVALGFDLAWDELQNRNYRPGPLSDTRRTRYVLAKIVLGLAQSGLHEPRRLCRRALKDLTSTLPLSVRRRLSEA
jgi:hypothetical protein